MATSTIQVSEEEWRGVLQAYHTLQQFLEKITPSAELYRNEFLSGLQEADEDVKAGRLAGNLSPFGTVN